MNKRGKSQAESLKLLLEKGRREKQLQESEVLALFDDPEGPEAQTFLEELEANHIELISAEDDDDLDLDLDDDDLLDDELDGGLDDDEAPREVGVVSDDPVRM